MSWLAEFAKLVQREAGPAIRREIARLDSQRALSSSSEALDRDRVLFRVSDLLRRTGASDAELLIAALEKLMTVRP